MALHESVRLGDMIVTRVPGGWIYRHHASYVITFVPICTEFLNVEINPIVKDKQAVFILNEQDIRNRVAKALSRDFLTTHEELITRNAIRNLIIELYKIDIDNDSRTSN